MSKNGVAMILIRAAEDPKFRANLRAHPKQTTRGYDISDEEIKHIDEIFQKIVEATNKMEHNLFNEMVQPLIPELPVRFMVALCCGGGGAMSNYSTCPQSCEVSCEACPQSCEVFCEACPQSCEASCEIVLARACIVNNKPEEPEEPEAKD